MSLHFFFPISESLAVDTYLQNKLFKEKVMMAMIKTLKTCTVM